MQFTPQKGVLVKKPLTIWFFFEIDCPICAFVRRFVLRPLAFEHLIILEPYEINSNIMSPPVKWFYDYSNHELGGDALTPTIRIIDFFYRDMVLHEDSVKICHLWSTKPKKVGHEDEEKAETLRQQILEAIALYRRKYVKETHNVLHLFNPFRRSI